MDIIETILGAVDPILIGPYRYAAVFLENPLSAWWAGTFLLALWAVALGRLTLTLGRRLNGRLFQETAQEARELSERSLNALRSGDKEAYKAINSLANEAFGKSFFQQAAAGASSLWPAFLGAAWLEARFGEIRFPCPGLEQGVNVVLPYLLCYIGAALVWRQGARLWNKMRV